MKWTWIFIGGILISSWLYLLFILFAPQQTKNNWMSSPTSSRAHSYPIESSSTTYSKRRKPSEWISITNLIENSDFQHQNKSWTLNRYSKIITSTSSNNNNNNLNFESNPRDSRLEIFGDPNCNTPVIISQSMDEKAIESQEWKDYETDEIYFGAFVRFQSIGESSGVAISENCREPEKERNAASIELSLSLSNSHSDVDKHTVKIDIPFNSVRFDRWIFLQKRYEHASLSKSRLNSFTYSIQSSVHLAATRTRILIDNAFVSLKPNVMNVHIRDLPPGDKDMCLFMPGVDWLFEVPTTNPKKQVYLNLIHSEPPEIPSERDWSMNVFPSSSYSSKDKTKFPTLQKISYQLENDATYPANTCKNVKTQQKDFKNFTVSLSYKIDDPFCDVSLGIWGYYYLGFPLISVDQVLSEIRKEAISNPWHQRKKRVGIMYSNSGIGNLATDRTFTIGDFVQNYAKNKVDGSSFPVDSAGSAMNNFKFESDVPKYGAGAHSEFRRFMRDYQYSLVFENTNTTDYVSEKLYAALFLGVIPLFKSTPSNWKQFVPCENQSCLILGDQYKWDAASMSRQLTSFSNDWSQEKIDQHFFSWFKNPTQFERNQIQKIVDRSMDNIWCFVAQELFFLDRNDLRWESCRSIWTQSPFKHCHFPLPKFTEPDHLSPFIHTSCYASELNNSTQRYGLPMSILSEKYPQCNYKSELFIFQ